jgi:diaminopimelate decarboxylase
VTPVLDVKRRADESLIVVDGTVFNVNPLRSNSSPLVFVSRAESASQDAKDCTRNIVFGNSCMEIDELARDIDSPISLGDILIFSQKGAYASCMSSPFIQGNPALMSIDNEMQLSLVTPRSDFHSLFI